MQAFCTSGSARSLRWPGSALYLLLALRLRLEGSIANAVVSFTLTGAASIVAHGLTAQPLMHRYPGWRQRMRAQRAIEGRRP